MDNMEIYNRAKKCPDTALKQIAAGRLKGKSDINPMWRIKQLTELFGACGIGWYYDVCRQWTEQGANGEISAFCNIALYIKVDGEWSKPILGTGGAAFVANEKNGLYTSDECFKMALTDAISVACKALGFAADVYWAADRTKYDQPHEPQSRTPQAVLAPEKVAEIDDLIKATNTDRSKLLAYYKVMRIEDMSDKTAENCIAQLRKKQNG